MVPTPYSIPATILPCVLLYDGLSLFFPALDARMNFFAVLSLLLLAVCDLLRVSCEIRTFRLISAEGVKHVLEPVTPRKKKLRRGKKLVKILNDDIAGTFYQLRDTEQITGFFRRFNALEDTSGETMLPLALCFGISIVLAFIYAFLRQDLFGSVVLFLRLLLVSAPFPMVFLSFAPLCRANRLLSRRNCALIGRESEEEYRTPQTLIFRDSDLFSAEKCTEVSVRESDDLRRDLRLAAILFRKIGGTLEEIGQSVPTPKGGDPAVTFLRIGENGVEAMIDNRFHMLAGTSAFLKRSGVRVPKESTDKALRRTENVSLMYIAIDGVLKLSYEIEYTPKKSFETLLADLCHMGTTAAIQTYDPNLNDVFSLLCRKSDSAPLRVLKPGRFETTDTLEVSDTGAVALGDRYDLARVLRAAKQLGFLRRIGWKLQLGASVLGCVAVFTAALMPGSAPVWYSASLIALFQTALVGVMQLVSMAIVNSRTLRPHR